MYRREVMWLRKRIEWRVGEGDVEEEEVNILRGGEENQRTGSAAAVNTESLPVVRAACSLLESNILHEKKELQ